MKNTHTVIKKKMRGEMSVDPSYKICSLSGTPGHECGGSVTWEHAIIYAGKKIQEKWAIIPLCERGHAVNRFQDAGTMNKELNEWVALNRATENDLRSISKAIDYIDRREYLNQKYGIWVPKKIPQTGIAY